MKTIVKLLIALTMLISVSCSKKDTVDTHKLKDTAWLREKFEENGKEEFVNVPPYWVQFEGADRYTSILSDGEYTFDNETGKLVFKGDATEYAVTVTGDKMVWEYGKKRETFRKLPKIDPKLFINKDKWWEKKEQQKFNLTNWKWEKPLELSIKFSLCFKDETSGSQSFGSAPSQYFTYTMKGNVLTGSLFDKKTIITELTERKLEYINMSESEGEKVYIKMIYGIDP